MTDEMVEDYDVWRKFPCVKGPVPRFHFNDPLAHSLIKEQTPVILTDCNLVATALKWDLAYLEEHIGVGPFAVFCHRRKRHDQAVGGNASSSSSCSCSQNDGEISGCSGPKRRRRNCRLNVFKYFDEKKLQALQDKSAFQQDMLREEMSFQEFLKLYKGDRSTERVYLQQPLNSTVGRQIAADFVGFDWPWAMEKQKEWGWGPLTSNLLLIGQKGNVTPCHYDEQQNLFCQLKGTKRFILFSPDNFKSLYPYPVHHPNDRQSQVDLDDPDYHTHPNFREANSVEAVINPGDILYIPMYWWHHVVNVDDTIAINFWHKAGPNTEIEYPLKPRQKVAMIRNIEKMLLEALQDQKELSDVLHWMVDGRF